jgi:rRNA maturation endonuclease Nob1
MKAAVQIRKRREKEAYEVRCHVCKGAVEVPCDQVRNNIGLCPRCGARLEIRWRVATT